MAIREILRMGNPRLREKSRELKKSEIQSPEIKTLIADMTETMHATQGIGIAAPQVGELLRLSVIEFTPDSARYPDMGEMGLTVFINPKWTVIDSTEQSFWEGCLSVPDLRGLVPRPRGLRVEYLDLNGDKQKIEVDGFIATVMQHEFDHLDGVLYIERVRDIKSLSFIDEYKQFWAPKKIAEDIGD